MLENKIIPAILTDTLEDFEEKVVLVEDVVDIIQIDYVDGYFAQELTCCDAKLIREAEIEVPLEAHLMVESPIKQVKAWYRAGAERIVGHIEEMDDQLQFVETVSNLGLEVGLALNLETPLSDLEEELIEGLDLVLLMGHKIGVQGSKFQRKALEKISELRRQYPNLNIEVDGGVNFDTIQEVKQAGANLFAVGSAIFESEKPKETFKRLTDLVK